jgi:hypothetical protein
MLQYNQLDYIGTTHLSNATAQLAHLLLRDTKPTAYAKAKEPNPFAPFYYI